MSITPAYPGVYIQELPSAVHAIIGVATSIAAFVGYTEADIDNRAHGVSASAPEPEAVRPRLPPAGCRPHVCHPVKPGSPRFLTFIPHG